MAQPPFEPTDEQRRLVETLAGFGIPQRQIATLVINPRTGHSVSHTTVEKFFEDELARGAAKATTRVAQNLFRIATTEDNAGPTVTAAIFWMKCRAGWREVSRMEHRGADGAPLVPDAVERLKSRIERLAGICEDDDEFPRMN
jgi:hypothetical protein